MPTNRKQYTCEFKLEVLDLAHTSGKSTAVLEQALGLVVSGFGAQLAATAKLLYPGDHEEQS